ncbi:hypothetical protein C4559_02680 [Candidatus Microgenomates bacterium]|nr:MAG: hypothetical protein C4559_02680 [Candidatus Microgenomates bacterium]
MNIIFILTSAMFFLLVLRSTLFWVSLWQTKEYRLDRFLTHFRETSQGKKLIFSRFLILKLLTIFSYAFIVINSKYFVLYSFFVFIIFFLELYSVRKEFLTLAFKRPVFTFKAKLITFLVLFLIFVFFFFPLVEYSLWMLVLDRFIFIFAALFVFMLSFPSDFYKDIRIEKAIGIINKHKKVLVIGVTGSYGKSSVKDYIAQVLEKKFDVVKTIGTNNTLIGISDTVIKSIKNDTQIFVVEMGAYKKGEISQICQVAKPKIGVITAVNSQHLSLFGNLQNTMDAKYELIDSLPKEGLAIFNGNNENAQKLYYKTIGQLNFQKRKAVLCKSFLNRDNQEKTNIFAFNIKVKRLSLEFDVLIGRKIINLNVPLIGAHNIENILPAIYIANYLGMTTEEIKSAVSTLYPLPKTMSYKKIKNGPVILDDTFNANPDAVLAAVNYMKMYKGKRILVLQPMIELGKNAKMEHIRVAREISKVCDNLFLTNKNYKKEILKGLEEAKGKCIVKIATAREISEFIKSKTKDSDIAVFEGKEAALALTALS